MKTIEFEVGALLETIGNGAFANTAIEVITIPENVTEIGDGAFKGCASLEEIVIPDSITSVGKNAFKDCTSLETLTVPISLEITKDMFEGGGSLKKVTFTEGTGNGHNYTEETYKNTPWSASNVLNLEIEISEGVAHIGDYIFYGRDNLTEADLPLSVTSIGKYAFAGTGITEIEMLDNVKSIGEGAFADTNLNTVILNDGLETIGDNAFANTAITSITIPGSVESIGEGAFADTNLSTIVLKEGLKTIGDNAFANTAITSITIPGSVESIGEGAFADTNLNTVTLNDGLKTIGDNAFAGTGITSITIPGSVTEIGNGAFDGCEYLADITLNEGLKTIGDNAFANTAIVEITIPNSVESIGKNLFKNCVELETISIPISLEIMEEMFEGCTNLKKIILTGNVGYDYNENTYMNTPWQIRDLISLEVVVSEEVTHIGEYMFYNSGSVLEGSLSGFVTKGHNAFSSTRLTEIRIPEGVTEIADGAYEGHTELETVYLPSTLETIGKNAFKDSGLTTITIPEGVTHIGEGAFENCFNLREIIIPNSVISIDENAFKECSNLTKLTMPIDVEITEGMFEGCHSLVEIILTGGSEGTGIDYTEETHKYTPWYISDAEGLKVKVSEGVNHIGDHTFNNCGNIAEVELDDSVTSIGNSAFEGCSNLNEIILNEGLKTIGDNAFKGTGITIVVIADTVTSIGNGAFANTGLESIIIPESVEEIGNGAFENCTNLVEIILNEGLKTIGDNAFKGTGITDVVIPDTVTSVGNNAFADCTELETVSIPITLEITEGMFEDCDSLAEIILTRGSDGKGHNYTDETYKNTPWYNRDLNNLEITISEGVEHIGDYTFYGCDDLTEAVLPSTTTSIGDNAFAGTGITEITIPEGVTEIGDGAFANTGLSSVTIPEGVESIGDGAFAGCGSLTEIVIPGTVESIGDNAFAGCENVTSLTIPADLEITAGMFEDLKNLEEIVITAGKTGEMPDYGEPNKNAPWNISESDDLKITVGPGVTHIGDNAFTGAGITEVEFLGDVESIGDNAFSGTGITEITIPDTVTEIGDGAFADTNLESVTIPENVTEIGNGVFEGCGDLTEVTILGDVKSIGDNAFAGTGITEITIPEGVTEIGDGAFANTGLTSVTLPESLETIGDGAFSNTGITSVEIPKNVTEIGADAFADCGDLKEVVILGSIGTISDNAFAGCENVTSLIIPADLKVTDETFKDFAKLEELTVRVDSDGGDATIDGSIYEHLGGRTFVVESVGKDGEIVDSMSFKAPSEPIEGFALNISKSDSYDEFADKIRNPTDRGLIVLDVIANNIPEGMDVRYNVGDTHAPGTILTHYYYDESGNIAKSGTVVVDENGYVTIPPSGYGLSNAFVEATSMSSAGENTQMIYWILVLPVIVVIGQYIGKRRGI